MNISKLINTLKIKIQWAFLNNEKHTLSVKEFV